MGISRYNYCKKLINVGVLASCLALSLSCAHKKQALKIIDPIEIKLKSKTGQEDISLYYSHSSIRNYQGMQLTREKDEVVEFKHKSKVTKVNPLNGNIHLESTVIEKDGTVDLHDLAFPEKDEIIKLVYNKDAEVLKAGDYPRESVFYVPPLSLPKEKVLPGDTWETNWSWVSIKNGIPLSLNLVTIFKNLYLCGQDDKCIDLEISGKVSIKGVNSKLFSFSSDITGRIIFSMNRGAVVWSHVKSVESLANESLRVNVWSCLKSKLVKPKNYSWKPDESVKCKPQE